MSRVAIIGDVHGDWDDLDAVLPHVLAQGITTVIQVGDFGYAWPGSKPWTPSVDIYHQWMDWGEDGDKNPTTLHPDIKLWWLDGNHENFNVLGMDAGEWARPHWGYLPRGRILELPNLPDGVVMGGATSVDKWMREAHVTWWPQENITYKQIADVLEEVDTFRLLPAVVFSHDHPEVIPYSKYCYASQSRHEVEKDRCSAGDRAALQTLFDKFKPKFWFFGHHHVYMSGLTAGCKWVCAPIIQDHQYLIWDGDDVLRADVDNDTISPIEWVEKA